MQLIGFFLPLIIMFGIFYFMIVKPQKKERTRLRELVEGLKKGDKVSTFSGIIGTVESVNETTVVINSKGSKLELLKEAVRGLE